MAWDDGPWLQPAAHLSTVVVGGWAVSAPPLTNGRRALIRGEGSEGRPFSVLSSLLCEDTFVPSREHHNKPLSWKSTASPDTNLLIPQIWIFKFWNYKDKFLMFKE